MECFEELVMLLIGPAFSGLGDCVWLPDFLAGNVGRRRRGVRRDWIHLVARGGVGSYEFLWWLSVGYVSAIDAVIGWGRSINRSLATWRYERKRVSRFNRHFRGDIITCGGDPFCLQCSLGDHKTITLILISSYHFFFS